MNPMCRTKRTKKLIVLLINIFFVSGMLVACVRNDPTNSIEQTTKELILLDDKVEGDYTEDKSGEEVFTGSINIESGMVEENTSEGSQVAEGYYAKTYKKRGEDLKAVLNDIISEDHGALSYDQVYSALEDTDEDPDDASKVLLFYKNVGVPDNYQRSSDDGDIWNREHIWAKSHGDFGTAKGPGTDLHMIRATDASVNARRGHLDFDYSDNVFEEAPDTYVDKDSFEPRDEVKGDVARMLFYMAVRYEGEDGEVDLELSDRTDTYYSNRDGYGEHGKLSALLEWHLLDPVDDLERFRNERIEAVQGNRNPFIDHPEFVFMIWGDGAFANGQISGEVDDHKAGKSEIQQIGDVRELKDNQFVTVSGTVTYLEKDMTMYIQDGHGGIRIDSYGTEVDLSQYNEGEHVIVRGILATYKGEREITITAYEDITKLNSGEKVQPKLVSLIELSEGMNQGQLVKVSGVEVIEVSNRLFVIEDSNGYRMNVYFGNVETLDVEAVTSGVTYTISGIASWYDEPQIKLIQGDDMNMN